MVKTVLCFVVALVFAFPSNAGEMEDREALIRQVHFMFMTESFAELESMAEDYRANEARTTSGIWKLTPFYIGISRAANSDIRDEKFWSHIDAKTARWLSRYPESPTPHNAHAILLTERAWAHRTGGWAYEVKGDDWKPFYTYIRKAREHLLLHKREASRDPRWYESMLIIARAEAWELSAFQSLVDEAVKAHPYFYQIYFAAIDYLTPKWHGDKRQIENFANFAVDKTNSRERTGMYARVYWYASQAQYGSRLFTDSAVVWSRMTQGITDVLARYPDEWNINNFAQFACQAGDKTRTRELIGRVVAPLPKVWNEPQNYSSRTQPLGFEACKNWSSGGETARPR